MSSMIFGELRGSQYGTQKKLANFGSATRKGLVKAASKNGLRMLEKFPRFTVKAGSQWVLGHTQSDSPSMQTEMLEISAS